MRLQSAIITITRTITVDSGLFAPGHLGELTPFIPFDLVDAVLAETGRMERRLRLLPSRVGVYFVLALTLFPELSAAATWKQLTASIGPLAPTVSTTALRHLRRRLTPAPFKALFQTLAVPLAPPSTPGVSYRGWRTVAFDGCSSIKTPDSARARGWLGKIRYRLAWAGYPTVMLMTLVETGTRGLLGACFGPTTVGETAYATRLLPLLNPSHLVLVDRGFDSNAFLADVAATGAQFLARLKSTRRPPLLRPLPDGSYLTRLGALTVRVIEADLTVRLADATTVTGHYRLATTLLDPAADPATVLIRLYGERWEIESAYFALRATLMKGRALRSRDRFGIEQELWATLTVYQALRMATTETALAAGADPDRAGFTEALQAARLQVALAGGITTGPAAITTAVSQEPSTPAPTPHQRTEGQVADLALPLLARPGPPHQQHPGRERRDHPARPQRRHHRRSPGRPHPPGSRAHPPAQVDTRRHRSGRRGPRRTLPTRPRRHEQRPRRTLARPRDRPPARHHQPQQLLRANVPVVPPGTDHQDRPRDLHTGQLIANFAALGQQ